MSHYRFIGLTPTNAICDMERYVVITWPYSQSLAELDNFFEHSFLISDDTGIEVFGNSAYFVEERWLNQINSKSLNL